MVTLGWSRPYINKQRSKIIYAFKWAVSQELIPESVYRALLTVLCLKHGRAGARSDQAGGRRFTTQEAADRFLTATNEAQATHGYRYAQQDNGAEERIEAAERRLAEEGI